jgi:hypothetical protein
MNAIDAIGQPARDEREYREKVITLLTYIANSLEKIDGTLTEIKDNRK